MGIVTAANNFFIVNNETLKKHKITSTILPLIQKEILTPSTIVIKNMHIKDLKKENRRVNFLYLPPFPKNRFSKGIRSYLSFGEKDGINSKYKMKLRKKWYSVPSVWSSEGLFIKRNHVFPRMPVNEVEVFVNDSFYRIKTKKTATISKLTLSFYNI